MLQRGLLSGAKPLTALWEFNLAPSTVRYISEFMALAHHREVVHQELVDYIKRFHSDAVEQLLLADADGRIHLGELDASGVVTALANAARGIAMQRALGTDEGHDAAIAIVRHLIERVEVVPPKTVKRRPVANRHPRPNAVS